MATVELTVSEVVMDWSVYPRNRLDEQNVARMIESLRAGNRLPAIVVEKGTHRLVDGAHRVRAMERFGGPTALIPAEEQEFGSDAELFLACCASNATHGIRLTPYDMALCTIKASEFGIDREQLAAVLHLQAQTLERLTSRKIAYDEAGQPLPIKVQIRHLAHERLGPLQIEAAKRSTGMSVLFMAGRILDALRSEIVDLTDAATRRRLQELRGAIGVALAAYEAEATRDAA